MSISCNQDGMDYPSWLTISGFVMTVLVFFMTHIFTNLSENKQNKIGDDILYCTIAGYFINALLLLTIVGILCFIFKKEHFGAFLVTVVLIVAPIYWLVNFIIQLENTKKIIINDIDRKARIMQPDLNKDESVATK